MKTSMRSHLNDRKHTLGGISSAGCCDCQTITKDHMQSSSLLCVIKFIDTIEVILQWLSHVGQAIYTSDPKTIHITCSYSHVRSLSPHLIWFCSSNQPFARVSCVIKKQLCSKSLASFDMFILVQPTSFSATPGVSYVIQKHQNQTSTRQNSCSSVSSSIELQTPVCNMDRLTIHAARLRATFQTLVPPPIPA